MVAPYIPGPARLLAAGLTFSSAWVDSVSAYVTDVFLSHLQEAATAKRLLHGVNQATSNLAAYLTPTHEDRWHRHCPEMYEANGEEYPSCFLIAELAEAVGQQLNEQLQPLNGRLNNLYNWARLVGAPVTGASAAVGLEIG